MFISKIKITIFVAMAAVLSGCFHLPVVESEDAPNTTAAEPVKVRVPYDFGGGGGGGGGTSWE